MMIIPYLVVFAVALLFAAICRFMIYGFPANDIKDLKEVAPVEKIRPVRPKVQNPVFDKEAIQQAIEKSRKQEAGDTTQIIPLQKIRTAALAANDDEKTKIISRDEMVKAKPVKKNEQANPAFSLEKEPEILHTPVTLPMLEEYFVRHFLNQYGVVSHMVEQDTRTVTKYIVEQLNMTVQEAADTLTHIMVQEALQNAQRTYVMMPNETVLHMVSDAFSDVARGHRSETKTILAYDALKAMPRMEENQFHALAVLLLFHYSRNTDNVNLEAFRKYTKKYITPLLADLPDEYSGYQQLEYIHCISLSNKETTFGRMLYDSYPLIFAYRGCMKSEFTSVKKDWPENSLVPSLYNSYYKPAVVDDSLLSRFYDDMGITDEKDRDSLNKLIHTRPVEYDRKELAYILEKISPDFVKMQEVWDTSLLRRSSLTLMGMYIAKSCIKALIGEEFDLSHWM